MKYSIIPVILLLFVFYVSSLVPDISHVPPGVKNYRWVKFPDCKGIINLPKERCACKGHSYYLCIDCDSSKDFAGCKNFPWDVNCNPSKCASYGVSPN